MVCTKDFTRKNLRTQFFRAFSAIARIWYYLHPRRIFISVLRPVESEKVGGSGRRTFSLFGRLHRARVGQIDLVQLGENDVDRNLFVRRNVIAQTIEKVDNAEVDESLRIGANRLEDERKNQIHVRRRRKVEPFQQTTRKTLKSFVIPF